MTTATETQPILETPSVTPLDVTTVDPAPETPGQVFDTQADTLFTPQIENVNTDVFVEQNIDSAEDATEVVDTEFTDTPNYISETTLTTINDTIGEEVEIDEEGLPVDIVGRNLRNSLRSFSEAATQSQLNDGFTRKQSRPLSQRREISDHFAISTADVGNGEIEVSVQPYGAASQRGIAGNTERRTRRVKAAKLARGAETGLNYVANFDRLDSRGRVMGGFEAFFDAIDPFFEEGERPAFSLAGRDADAIGVAQEVADSFNLYANWDRIDDTQRFRATANQMVQLSRELGFRLPETAANSIGLLNFGFSAHRLLNDWDNMSEAQRVYATLNTINSGVQAFNTGAALFSSSAVAGTTAAGGSAAAAGGSATAGGAAAGSAAAAGGSAAAGGAAGGGGTAATAATYAGYAASLYGVYNIIDNWGQGGADGRVNGAASGAAAGSYFGPWGAAIGAVVGLAIGSIKTGKSVEQEMRDAYRGHYEKNGLFEKIDGSHQVQLADGSFYNVGIDGRRGRATYQGKTKVVEDPSKLSIDMQKSFASRDNEVLPYNIDISNDLDFHTGVAARTVNLIMNGGSNWRHTEADQMNGYLTNAATSNIESREFNEDNWNKAMANVRGYYAKLGLDTREKALKYVEALKTQKKLSTHDYNTARLGIEYAFEENSFERATQVNKEIGRDKPLTDEEHSQQLQDLEAAQQEDREAFEAQREAEEARQRAIREAFS